jgi:hypothetical protein
MQPKPRLSSDSPYPFFSVGRTLGVIAVLLLLFAALLKPLTGSSLLDWIQKTDFQAAYSPQNLAKTPIIARMDAGDIDGAWKMALALHDPETQESAMAIILDKYIQKGKAFSEIQALVAQITNPTVRQNVASTLLISYSSQEKWEEVIALSQNTTDMNERF